MKTPLLERVKRYETKKLEDEQEKQRKKEELQEKQRKIKQKKQWDADMIKSRDIFQHGVLQLWEDEKEWQREDINL